MPALLKPAERLVPLNSIQSLTRGGPLTLSSLIFNINPAYDQVILICESEKVEKPLITQVFHELGSPSAVLTYLIADEDTDKCSLAMLLEEITSTSIGWGAHNLLCELESKSPFMEAFLKAEFSVWGKQRFWQVDADNLPPRVSTHSWRMWNNSDIKAMRALYQSLVPKIFHNLEPLTRNTALGLVCINADGGLTGYADLVYGPKGIWVLPIIHPESADDPEIIISMLYILPNRSRRPVYICARSYQPWIEQLLQQLNGSSSAEQMLLVKYIAQRQKVSSLVELRELKNGRADSGVPVVHIEGKPAARL